MSHEDGGNEHLAGTRLFLTLLFGAAGSAAVAATGYQLSRQLLKPTIDPAESDELRRYASILQSDRIRTYHRGFLLKVTAQVAVSPNFITGEEVLQERLKKSRERVSQAVIHLESEHLVVRADTKDGYLPGTVWAAPALVYALHNLADYPNLQAEVQKLHGEENL